MMLPLNLWDISLLLAAFCLLLLITTEILSPQFERKINLLISRRKMQNVAIFTSFLFLCAIALRVVLLMSS